MITFFTNLRLDVFSPSIEEPYTDPFKSVDGFDWENLSWSPSSLLNTNALIPMCFDPDLSKLPDAYFQSGIGSKNDLEFNWFDIIYGKDYIRGQLRELDCLQAQPGNTINSAIWSSRVKYGDYYVQQNHGFLYPNDGVATELTDKDSYNRNVANLLLEPKYGVPISVTQFGYDEDHIVPIDYFSRVEKFTGRMENGYRLDTSTDPLAIDITKKEFTVDLISDYIVQEKLEPETSGPEYNFVLEHQPIYPYPVTFTRKDIFRTEFVFEEWSRRKSLGILEHGDYYVGYKNEACPSGMVEVYSLYDIETWGNISYAKDYPAKVILNQDYAQTFEDDDIGSSNGQAWQVFHPQYVPLLDYSTDTILDTDNISVLIEYPDGIQENWTRVSSLTEKDNNGNYLHAWDDKIFEVDPDHSEIKFGGGSSEHTDVPGWIPPWGSLIKLSYTTLPIVQYTPEGSGIVFTDPDLNLNPAFNIVTRGFLYLSGRKLIPSQVRLETYIPWNESINLYGPVTIGSQNIVLRAQVLTSKNEPVPNTIVRFLDEPNMGAFAATYVVSNIDGYAYNRYDLGSTLEDLSYKIHLYDTHLQVIDDYDNRNPNVPTNVLSALPSPIDGNKLTIPYPIENLDNDILTEVYVFGVYNDQALNPYDITARSGGRWNILHYYDSLIGKNFIMQPINITQNINMVELEFASDLPTPDMDVLWEGTAWVSPFENELYIPTGFADSESAYSVEVIGPDYYQYNGDYFIRAMSQGSEGYRDLNGNQTPYIGFSTPGIRSGMGGTLILLERPVFKSGLTTSGNEFFPYQVQIRIHRRNYHLMGFLVITPTVLNIKADLPCTNRVIKSNILQFGIILPPQYTGIWALDPGQVGSALGVATYLVLNEIELTGIESGSTIIINGRTLPKVSANDDVVLTGENFPTDRTVPVWIDNVLISPTNVIVVSDEMIRVKMPAHTDGYAVIAVGNMLSDKSRKLLFY